MSGSAPHPPRAILLDALGVLLALEPPAPLLREELRTRFGVELTEDEANAAVVAEITYYLANHDRAGDRASLAEVRRGSAQALRDALPPAGQDLPIEPLTDALLAAIRFTPYPEVVEVLSAARARGIRLGVVSNWDVSLHDALDEAGLAPLLDAVVTSAEFGAAKPDPSIFAHALTLLGVAAAEAVHVGDGVDVDVEGARAAGVEALLLERNGAATPDGVTTIRTLRELPGIAA